MSSSTKQSSLKTPLGRVRGLGAAKGGTHHWWMQRVTGMALIPLAGFFLFNLDKLIHPVYSTMMVFLANPPVTIALILFILCAYYHAFLGIQVIIEDYVHGALAKNSLRIFNKFFFLALTVCAIYATLLIGFNFADYASAQ